MSDIRKQIAKMREDQKELDRRQVEYDKARERAKSEKELQRVMLDADEDMNILQTLDGKSEEFIDGFWAGRDMKLNYDIKFVKLIREIEAKLAVEFPDLLPEDYITYICEPNPNE